jgi:hypothetical protein
MKPQTAADTERVCRYLVQVAQDIRRDTAEVVATRNHIDIIKHFNQVRLMNEQIKEAREALGEMERVLSQEQVPAVMREHNVRNITVEGVGRVALSNRWSCSMLDKELGMDWLRNSGNESLIIETVNASTLAAFARNMSETENKELPSDIFKTSVMTYTSITKAGVIKDNG